MKERRPSDPMVPQNAEEPQAPFDRATIEVEALPDGRRIRYFSWPADETGSSETADAPDPDR